MISPIQRIVSLAVLALTTGCATAPKSHHAALEKRAPLSTARFETTLQGVVILNGRKAEVEFDLEADAAALGGGSAKAALWVRAALPQATTETAEQSYKAGDKIIIDPTLSFDPKSEFIDAVIVVEGSKFSRISTFAARADRRRTRFVRVQSQGTLITAAELKRIRSSEDPVGAARDYLARFPGPDPLDPTVQPKLSGKSGFKNAGGGKIEAASPDMDFKRSEEPEDEEILEVAVFLSVLKSASGRPVRNTAAARIHLETLSTPKLDHTIKRSKFNESRSGLCAHGDTVQLSSTVDLQNGTSWLYTAPSVRAIPSKRVNWDSALRTSID